ncbi:MAG: lysostaphin resistance A-like protein, partial [Candidatus Rokuibacteriota bacterium]
LASSIALVLTLVATVRPLDARRVRLVPGRETGPMLVLIIVGTLALGQALDSATAIAGLANRGAMAEIRRALEGAAGADLFAAVLVIGPIAGAAEEIFFRGFMQTALVAVWRPAVAVAVTAAAFALLHVEPIHATLALALGLWFGAVTERAGSALPAVAAHVVNNAVFTLLTALSVTIEGVGPNLAAGGGSAIVFVAAALALRRYL